MTLNYMYISIDYLYVASKVPWLDYILIFIIFKQFNSVAINIIMNFVLIQVGRKHVKKV